MTDVKKYIRFEGAGWSDSGKTQVVHVTNIRTREITGEIRWYGGFRKYAFFPNTGFLFDMECLRFIADELDAMNKVHKESKARKNVPHSVDVSGYCNKGCC